jgi:hypothetical protein
MVKKYSLSGRNWLLEKIQLFFLIVNTLQQGASSSQPKYY